MLAGLLYLLPPAIVRADDDLSDMLNNSKTAITPPVAPVDPSTQPDKNVSDALGTMKPKPPRGSREGTITINGGEVVQGRIWTTLETPFRIWIDETKTYQDIDFSLVKKIEVHVLSEQMEDDWRWLKEGSDQKVFSGKKYPNVELNYKFTLLNGQVAEGAVVAPIYLLSGDKRLSLALYKKYKGKLDQTLKDLVYIRTIELEPPQPGDVNTDAPKATTKLPLLD